MKLYILSIGAGLLVGVVYSLLGVRSPAPPLVALAGLLGILAGEQLLPAARRWMPVQEQGQAQTMTCASPCIGHEQNGSPSISPKP
jgi:XapX domain-containing protein